MSSSKYMHSPAVEPSGLEVDYDRDVTDLYAAITDCRWDDAVRAAQQNPVEAKTWVVRYYEDEDEIMWRFLPIHSACARQPPASVIEALLKAYPDGARCVDDQGMYPLHYACGNRAAREVVRLLLMSFAEAAKICDPRGMLPIHHLACWGPSAVSIVDMVLVANRNVSQSRDEDGNSPLDLAMEADYPERDSVIAALKRWASNTATTTTTGGGPSVAESAPSSKNSRSLQVDIPMEEKKESDDLLHTPSSVVSPHTVGRLKQQIQALESESVHYVQKTKLRELSHQVRALEIEVESGNKHIDQLENSVRCKDMELTETLKELKAKDVLLKQAMEERDGLRKTLAEVYEEHDRYKRNYDSFNDRIRSLNASLYTMMEQQKIVVQCVANKEEKCMDLAEKRRQKLQELVALEEEMTYEDQELTKCLGSQTKEMEAINAVIAAVRQATS